MVMSNYGLQEPPVGEWPSVEVQPDLLAPVKDLDRRPSVSSTATLLHSLGIDVLDPVIRRYLEEGHSEPVVLAKIHLMREAVRLLNDNDTVGGFRSPLLVARLAGGAGLRFVQSRVDSLG